MSRCPVSKPRKAVPVERNPCYWKVDAEGNQLPYIDTVRLEYAANTEVTKLKIAQSEARHRWPARSDHDGIFYKENEPTANTWWVITSPRWATG
jgi:peptide/nickel transport system substrate-binding protein